MLLFSGQELVEYAENFDLDNIITPIRVNVLKDYMLRTKFPAAKGHRLLEGFTKGFDIGYTGPVIRQSRASNIPLKVGSKTELWNKLIKEVKLGRVAGPFKEIPFKNFIQSPIGLVPKDHGTKTRLIFHLSYDFCEQGSSLNACTPKDECSVTYRDLDHAVCNSLKIIKKFDLQNTGIFYGRTDVSAAFRILPLRKNCWPWLIMKARNPATGLYMYFSDKCVPFGSSKSCKLFQDFSDCLQHIAESLLSARYRITNYLDDFLIIGESEQQCAARVRSFLRICEHLNCPIAMEKTELATQEIVFLGLLLDGRNCIIAVPEEKRCKAVNTLQWLLSKNKIVVKELQRLTGLLNFLNKAIVPGRPFTRRMYAKCTLLQHTLKPYHHIKIDDELKFDCRMWLWFLEHHKEQALCRPFVDFSIVREAEVLQFFSDASMIGFGCFFQGNWIAERWPRDYIETYNPSIAYLELYALCVAVFAWQDKLKNCRIAIYCDNGGIKDVVNDMSSRCKQNMVLVRMLALNNIIHNRRLFVDHIRSEKNILADRLSRQNFREFWRYAPANTKPWPEKIPQELNPVDKLWFKQV